MDMSGIVQPNNNAYGKNNYNSQSLHKLTELYCSITPSHSLQSSLSLSPNLRARWALENKRNFRCYKVSKQTCVSTGIIANFLRPSL